MTTPRSRLWLLFAGCTSLSVPLFWAKNPPLQWSNDSAGALFNAIIPTDWGICYYLKVLFLDTPLAYFLITWFGSTALCTARTTRWRRRGRSLTLRYFTRAILILIFSEILILHIPKFCYLVHWFQNYFCFCSRTFPSHGGSFFGFNGNFNVKMTKKIKWPKITFRGSKMVPKVSKWGYLYWKVVLEFWFGHPKCHFRDPQNTIFGVLGVPKMALPVPESKF